LLRRLPKHMQQSVDQTNLFSAQIDTPVVQSLRVVDWPQILSVNAGADVLLHVVDGMVWLSTDHKTVSIMAIGNVDVSLWRTLEMMNVVTFDAKQMYHVAHDRSVGMRFDMIHDIAQASFLIDSLQRDRSISGLAGYSVDETDAGQVMAALWQIYAQQLTDFERLPEVAKVARQLDFPLTYMLFRMEAKGLKIDRDLLMTMSQELGEHHAQLEQEMYTLVGREFNIGSPAQLSEVLFTDLELPTKGIKKGKTAYSTGQKELDKLRGQHPIIELIEQTRELSKLKNTYVDTLPKLADDNDRVHTTFNQDVASTGRLSSTNPNLQNIPVRTELGRKIRQAFIPESGNVFVSADYSQFELRLAAVLAGDSELITDFNGNVDIHTKTASQVYGIPMGAVTKDQRRAAKVINFGVLYGMSPHGLSAATGMSFTEAKSFIDHYFALRSSIRCYIDTLLETAATDGYVATYFGRRRPTPDINSSNFMIREGAKRAAANMPIQGTEADLMKMAMLEVDKKLGNLGSQVLQVHDSILIECPADNAQKVSELLRDTMENIYPTLGVSLRVDVSTGSDWGQL
ncbi:MAG: DNA polymerase, partial [Candidatus Saccharimonadales bacterium]